MFEFSPHDHTADARVPTGLGGRWYGVFPALVTDIRDPDGQGRVKIMLPWAPDTGSARYETWARLSTFMGGNDRGSWFVPDVNDEVLVACEHGDPARPYIVGALWNGTDAPPQSMDGAGKNFKKVLRSRNGVKITLDDTDGVETLILETPGGQTVTLQDGPGSIQIVDSNGNSIKLQASGITLEAAAKITLNAPEVEVTSPIVNVNAGMTKISGVTQTDTLISNSVISAAYTPGAGNIW